MTKVFAQLLLILLVLIEFVMVLLFGARSDSPQLCTHVLHYTVLHGIILGARLLDSNSLIL